MMASVSGSRMRMVEPLPRWLSTATVPRSPSIDRLTTSIPTPRPETLETARAVEKPGRKIRANSSLSESLASASTSPRSRALARMAAGSSPAPSSWISMQTLGPEWKAESRMVPRGGLPAAARASGPSIPWSQLLRMRWTSGSPSRSMTVLSSSVSAPSVTRSISLPSSAERSCTSRLNRPKVVPMGTMRTSRVESRSSVERRSRSSETASSSGASSREAMRASRAWAMTSSPTRSTSRSSLAAPTRRVELASTAAASRAWGRPVAGPCAAAPATGAGAGSPAPAAGSPSGSTVSSHRSSTKMKTSRIASRPLSVVSSSSQPR